MPAEKNMSASLLLTFEVLSLDELNGKEDIWANSETKKFGLSDEVALIKWFWVEVVLLKRELLSEVSLYNLISFIYIETLLEHWELKVFYLQFKKTNQAMIS